MNEREIFMIRIELHGPGNDAYDVLDEAMTEEGFDKTVIGAKDNAEYKLPDGVYLIYSRLENVQVRAKAIRAVKKVDCKDFSVMVSGRNLISWRSLTKTS